jgi:N-acetylneuraminic acid mutarotase
MPTARYALRASVVDGKIYAIGGADALAPMNGDNRHSYSYAGLNEEYNPATDSWSNKTAMPMPLRSFGVAVHQNEIYCFSNRTTEVYNPADDTWTIKQGMPHPRINVGAEAVNGKIYVFGGRTGGPSTTVGVNDVYDPLTDTWATKAAMPYPATEVASAVVGEKIYVFGGQDEYKVNGTMTLSTTQIYDTATDSWSLGASLPQGVWMAAAGVNEKAIYVIGGQLDKQMNATDMVQIYDPEEDSWVNGTSMPSARFGLAIAVIDKKLYAIGGTEGYLLPGEEALRSNEAMEILTVTPPPENQPSSQNYVFIALIVGVCAIAAVSVILIIKRRNKKPSV